MLSRETLRDWGLSLLWLVLFATPVLFSRATTEAFEYPKLMLVRAAAVLFLCGALATGWRWREAVRDQVALGVSLSWLAAAVSTLLSISPRTSVLGAEGSFAGLLTLTAYAVLFFAARALCADAAAARTLLAAGVAGAGVSIAYGLAQFGGLDPLPWRAPVVFSGVSRVFSTQGHPNSLAQLLALALPLALYLLLRAVQQRRFDAVVGYGFVVLGGVALTLLTLSRAGVAAMAAAVAVLWMGAAFTSQPRRRWLALTSLAGALVLGLALTALSEEGSQRLDALWQRLAGSGAGAIEQDPRRQLWTGAWSTFREHPFVGAGVDCFSLAFAARRSPDAWRSEWGQTPVKAHNQPLELLATRGLLGAAAALLVVFGLVRALVRSLRSAGDAAFLALAAFAGLVAFGVHNLFHFPTAAGMLLALTLGAILSRPGEPQRASAPLSHVRLGVAAALGVAALVLGVLRPLRADVLCRAGTDATPVSPALAVSTAERALRLDASRSLLWQRLAAAYQAAARAEPAAAQRRQYFLDARRAAEEALRLEASAYAAAHLGMILSDLEREAPPLATRGEVEQAFVRAQARDPSNSFVHTAAATAALRAADLASVESWAGLCLGLYPDFAPPRALLGAARLGAGRALLAAGNSQRAREELQAAIALLREAHAADWRGDDAARAAAKANRLAAMRALAALD